MNFFCNSLRIISFKDIFVEMFDEPEKITEEQRKKKQKRDSSSSESSLSPDEDIEEMKIREYKRRVTYSEDIDAQTKLKSYEFLGLKNKGYSYEKSTGIQHLIHFWQQTHQDTILPLNDLKKLILIVLKRSDEVPDNVVKIVEDVEYAYGGCCGLFLRPASNDEYIGIIRDIIIVEPNDSEVMFENVHSYEYGFISNALNISLRAYIKDSSKNII